MIIELVPQFNTGTAHYQQPENHYKRQIKPAKS